MDFDQFTAKIIDALKLRLLQDGDDAVIRTDKVLKNNGVELTAINICCDHSDVCPTVYLEPFYREYEQGMDISDLAGEILKLHAERNTQRLLSREKVLDESDVMDNIILRLVNRSKNSKLLQEIPYIEFKDLAITFRRLICMDADGMATSVVSMDDMRRWNVNIDVMFRKALENTERIFPASCKNVFEALNDRYSFDMPDVSAESDDDLYVLTNEYGINGAASILYSGALKKCADIVDDDIYILPSSIHEVLFIKVHSGHSIDYLKELVSEANRSVVTPMDYLSDSVYIYYKESGELMEVSDT